MDAGVSVIYICVYLTLAGIIKLNVYPVRVAEYVDSRFI